LYSVQKVVYTCVYTKPSEITTYTTQGFNRNLTITIMIMIA